MRRAVLIVVVALVAAAPAAAQLKALHVAIKAQDHQPRVGKHWQYEVRVTDTSTGKPVACRIHLQFLFGTLPVGEVGVHVVRSGFWQETFGTPGNPSFPAAARGQRLVLQATATAKGYRTAKAGWAIVPR